MLCRNGSDVHRILCKSPPKFYTLASNSDAHTAVVKQNVLMSCMPPRDHRIANCVLKGSVILCVNSMQSSVCSLCPWNMGLLPHVYSVSFVCEAFGQLIQNASPSFYNLANNTKEYLKRNRNIAISLESMKTQRI